MTTTTTGHDPSARAGVQSLARVVLVVFLLTFVAARVMVYLIMSRRAPDLYLHLGGTHVHHLNYGIFLLSAAGALFLFAQPRGRALRACAVLYAIGLALTFDEFGMWLHLGGSYWQRASYDAVVVIASVLALIGLGPSIGRFAPRHWVTSGVVVVSLVVFALTWRESLQHAGQRLRLRLEAVEAESPA